MKYFWFGRKYVLTKTPDDKEWKVLTEHQDNDEDIWIPVRDIENGTFWFDNFSEQVGLSKDCCIQKITAELFDEMLEIAQTKRSIFFMPPNQMAHIGNILNRMKYPPLAAIPEMCLLDNPSKAEIVHKENILTSENYYVPNWNEPNNVNIIDSSLENNINFSQEKVPTPVLMPATALATNETIILGHYTESKKLVFYETELVVSQLLKKGNREVGVGLVWVWGRGKKLWQWALPYTQINKINQEKIILTQSDTSFDLHINGKKHLPPLTLTPPVIDWHLSKKA